VASLPETDRSDRRGASQTTDLLPPEGRRFLAGDLPADEFLARSRRRAVEDTIYDPSNAAPTAHPRVSLELVFGMIAAAVYVLFAVFLIIDGKSVEVGAAAFAAAVVAAVAAFVRPTTR
jgi:hypothetical protein